MLRKILNHYANRLVSRWVILLIDLMLVIISFVMAYAIRFNFDTGAMSDFNMGNQLLFISCFYLTTFLIFRPYSGIIRHTSMRDVENILYATGAAFGVYLTLNILNGFYPIASTIRIPYSILITHFLVVTFTMISIRFFIKSFYFNVVRRDTEPRLVMIYGAGKSGLITKNALEQDDRYKYRVAGFIDDNPSKVGKKLEGVPVFAKKAISNKLLKQMNIAEVIISIQNIPAQKKRAIVDFFLEMDVIIKNTPSTSQWMEGELSSKQIRTIRIEELLERDEIRLDHKNVKAQVADQVVLVTGAAGSIGSEISRQLLYYKPKKLILVDQAESPLYELVNDLEQKFNGIVKDRVVTYVCDVCNQIRTDKIFDLHKPQVVYHAAAYKHVPLMEMNPSEAVEVNVLGTKNIVDLAVKYNANNFVLVSTDKAVNPTNIMGASKRIAEMYCQSRQQNEDIHTKFITTRFGNVLGSNGSVVPLFKKQIERGGPVTITDSRVTRYFMTIPEACELVLEAGAMGNGGEIFVFDMGEPIKIMDLAKKMIRLSGYSEHEIAIKTVGLRPGEKLYEEVLSSDENSVETHHPKINIAKVRKHDRVKINDGLDALLEALLNSNEKALVSQMKKLVPEFISNNSSFEELDRKPHDPFDHVSKRLTGS
ncbi:MAG: polysaccharide biosynthesis protein [Bacteroidota bacterium]